MNRLSYRAPWSTSLKGMTALSIAILMTIPVVGFATGGLFGLPEIACLVGIPILLLLCGALFTIRGYELGPDILLIRRLGWTSTLSLSGLRSAEADPDAMARSLRLCGNGGMFCFAGLFRNKKLGSYRAFVMDPSRSVVLKNDSKTYVVSPDDPEDFVSKLKELKGL